jgi:hypothetical protein
MNIFFCFIVFLFSFYSVFSQDTLQAKSPYTLIGGFSGGIGFHTGGFKGIPGFASCCTEYPSTNGVNIGAYIGIQNKGDIINIPRSSLGFTLRYSMIQSGFSTREYIGNIINNNSVEKALIDFTLQSTLHYISAEPYITYSPDFFPLDISIGPHISFMISSSAEQKEEIVSPANVYFGNNQKILTRYSGSLSDQASLLLGGMISFGKKFHMADKYSLVTSLVFRPYFTPFIQSIPWQSQSAELQCELQFNIPKSIPFIPIPEPIIIPEKEPDIPALTLDFAATYHQKKISFGDTIPYEYSMKTIVQTQPLFPTFTFDEFSDTSIQKQNVSLELLVKAYNETPAKTLIIKGYSIDDEDKNMAEKRASFIAKQLKINGLDNPITIQTEVKKLQTIKYQTLKSEYHIVSIQYNDGSIPILIQKDTTLYWSDSTIEFTSIPSQSGAKISGLITLGTTRVQSIEEPNVLFRLQHNPATPFSIQTLTAKCFASISPMQKAASRIECYIKPVPRKSEILINKLHEFEEHILSYSEFDRSDIQVYNPFAIQRIKDAILEKKRVDIIPISDGYGTEDHNIRLQKKRVEKALEFLSQQNINSIELQTLSKNILIDEHDKRNIRTDLQRGILIRIFQE